MRRANSVQVFLPEVREDDLETLQGFDYARRVVVPTLDEVIGAFEGSLKEAASAHAEQAVGFDENWLAYGVRLVKEECEYVWESAGDWKFKVESSPDQRVSYQGVVEAFRQNLNWMLVQGLQAFRADGVRRDEGEVYVWTDLLLSQLRQFEDLNRGFPFTRQEVSSLDFEGEDASLDASVDSMRVFVDGRYSRLCPSNALSYMLACSLKERVLQFEDEVKEGIRLRNGFATNYGSHPTVTSEFDDGSAARFLAFGRTTPAYSQIFKALASEGLDEVGSRTGDFEVLRKLPEVGHYKKHGIEVSAGVDDSGRVIEISRKIGGVVDTRAYHVQVQSGGKVYVRLRDVSEILDRLQSDTFARTHPQLKVDFFPRPPAYLQARGR